MSRKQHPTQVVLNKLFKINDGKHNQDRTLNHNRKHASPFIVYPVINTDSQTIDVYVATQYKISDKPNKQSILIATLDPKTNDYTWHNPGLFELEDQFTTRHKNNALRLFLDFEWESWVARLTQRLIDIKPLLADVTFKHTRFNLYLTEQYGSKTLKIEFDKDKTDDKRHIRRFIQDHIQHSNRLDALLYIEDRSYSAVHANPKLKATPKQYKYMQDLYKKTGETPKKIYGKFDVGTEIRRLEQKVKEMNT